MNKVKKPTKRDSLANERKIPLNTVPSAYLIEELRIPTGSSDVKGMGRSLQLRNMPKSVELRKTAVANPKKKSNPRKGSVKMTKAVNGGSQALRTITQTFKQLKQIKLSHQKYRPKSKSPTYISRSAVRLFPKKKSVKTNPNFNSERLLLGLNLQKTIKQINMQELMQEEDSFLMRSSSNRREAETYLNISSENEDSINMAQVKNYCIQIKKKESIQFSAKNSVSFQRNRAAAKIQRAWRRHQTRMLVQRYSTLFLHVEKDKKLFTSKVSAIDNQPSPRLDNSSHEIIVTFENSIPQTEGDGQVNKIESADEDIVERFKREQLERWDQIISIISLNKSCNPTDIPRLLQILTEQSQNNKRNIEALTYNLPNHGCKKENIKAITQAPSIADKHQKAKFEYSASDRSIQINEYDNKKYIQFLDADIFPNQFTTESPQFTKTQKVSETKQQLLLQHLKNASPFEFALNHSESLKELRPTFAEEHTLKIGHRRSISQKARLDQEDSQNTIDLKAVNFDVDQLIENFLQDSNPHESKVESVVVDEKLRIKGTDFSKLKQSYQEQQPDEKSRRTQAFNECGGEQGEGEEVGIMKRSPPAFSLHRGDELIKMQVQQVNNDQYEEDFESNSEEGEKASNTKHQTCASIILDKLIFQVLREIAKSDRVCEAFKSYTRSSKQQKSKIEPPKKKKGFSTSKAEIELFLTNLLNYLQKEHLGIFKNLEVPTGPTALEMLRFMHEQVEEEQDSDDENEVAIMVLPNRVFDAFWALKEQSIIIEIPQAVDQTTNIFRQQLDLLKSLNKIFYRCMFDTFNECLDCERNFGQYGRPFPWKRSPAFSHSKSESTLENHVKNAKKRMMDICTIYCGLIVEKEDIGTIDEDYIKQIHEERLSRMLAGDFLQMEDRWIFYDDQETEILVEISYCICAELMSEAMHEFDLPL